MLLDESRRRHRWQTTMMEITTGLLAGDDPHGALRALVRFAWESLGAEGAGINLPIEDSDEWYVALTEGSFDRFLGVKIPMEGSITATAIRAGDLVIVEDPTRDERTWATTRDEVPGMIGESLAVPLRGDRGVTGVLVAARRPGTGGFDQLDRDMIRAIAAHAGLALELAQVRRDNESLRRLEDRAEIAETLRQRVIQRLFQHGLALNSAALRIARPEAREAIQSQITEVDQIITDIRAAVFSLNPD
jgi:GAF domain-containing protein